MRISDAYPSRYLKCEQLRGKKVTVIMDDVVMEEVGDGESKPVLYFKGKNQGLVLNKTNASMLSTLFGDETDSWKGQTVELRPEKVPFAGKIVDAIRVYAAQAPAPAAAAEPAPAADNFDDKELPF